MFSVPRIVSFLSLVVVCASPTIAHPQSKQVKEQSGAISGRVTIDDRPARGVIVMLSPGEPVLNYKTISKATTDNDGYFQIRGLPAGGYTIQAFAPALVSNNVWGRQSQIIHLSDGESVDGIDLSLKPGGVITGRVTDADGQPVIQENIRLITATMPRRQVYLPYSYMMFSTDDRGMYRIFGVPPGQYLVAAGGDPNGPPVPVNGNNPFYHPDTSDESKATIIEVTPGSETSGVDIVMRSSKLYTVSGRIIDAVSGKPIVGMMYGYGIPDAQGRGFTRAFSSGSTTTAKGEFRLQGVSPGQYAAYAQYMNDSDFYSDLAPFTITDGDVAGLTIKVHAGSRITGNVIIEGAEGQQVPRVSDIQVSFSSGSVNASRRGGTVRIAPDGSFRIGGLPPGITSFYFQSYSSPKGLALARVERDGVEPRQGIEVGSDEDIIGVKLIFSYGTGWIRGQVKVEGGEITPNTMMFLDLRPVGSKDPRNNSQMVDARGRFVIPGLSTGDYELTLVYQSRQTSSGTVGGGVTTKQVKQRVSVTNGTETQVTLIVDLNKEQ